MSIISLVYIATLLSILIYYFWRRFRERKIKEDEEFHEMWCSLLLRWMLRCAKLVAALPTFFAYGIFYAQGQLFTLNGIFIPIAAALAFYVLLRFFIAAIYQRYMSIRRRE